MEERKIETTEFVKRLTGVDRVHTEIVIEHLIKDVYYYVDVIRQHHDVHAYVRGCAILRTLHLLDLITDSYYHELYSLLDKAFISSTTHD